jgi:hypothetical protein
VFRVDLRSLKEEMGESAEENTRSPEEEKTERVCSVWPVRSHTTPRPAAQKFRRKSSKSRILELLLAGFERLFDGPSSPRMQLVVRMVLEVRTIGSLFECRSCLNAIPMFGP